MCGKRVFRMSARILVPAHDMNPVAIAGADSWCITRDFTHVCITGEEDR